MNTKQHTRQMSVRLPEDLWCQLTAYAQDHHRSVHGLLLDLAREGLSQRQRHMPGEFLPSKYGGIYTITCLSTKAAYLGASLDIETRFTNHRSLLRHGTHPCQALQQAWNEHGEEQFRLIVLEYSNDQVSLKEREAYWLRQCPNLYNAGKQPYPLQQKRPTSADTQTPVQQMDTAVGLLYTCTRCAHQWVPRVVPVRWCPKCHSPYWDKPRQRPQKSRPTAVSSAAER